MGNVIAMVGGGGAADSDELTANRSHVLSGYTAITHDSDGEPTTGTMPNNGAQSGALNCGQSKTIPAGYTTGGTVTANSLLSQTSANANVGQILNGQTAWVNGSKITGNMPNRGNVSQALNAGGSYTIPAGYHAGSGKVTANSLASQTGGATADDSKVLSGYTYWKDGAKRTGSLTVSSVVSFKVAQYSNLTLIASWAKPSKGPWSGLRVMCKQGSYPSSTSDGTVFYEGSGITATKSLAAGAWYFRVWNYITTSQGRIYGGYSQAFCGNVAIKGTKTFTASGIFTVPSYVRSVQVFAVGGGGGVRQDQDNPTGGAGGGYTRTVTVNVSPGQSYAVQIGAGGVGRNAGGVTTFGSEVSAAGGSGNSGRYGQPGGSGGGGAAWGSSQDADPGDGGSDGSDGGDGYVFNRNGEGHLFTNGGTGQHSTTRAFGESSGTLYAGGGGGYGDQSYDTGIGGAGGGGHQYGDGAVNTGGGAGGKNYAGEGNSLSEASGGSGILLIRWGY